MSESLRHVGVKSERMYKALIKALRERAKEDRESREIHLFVKNLSDADCRAFVEDALQYFRETDSARDYGNVMVRALHMYGYEIYPKLKRKWQS